MSEDAITFSFWQAQKFASTNLFRHIDIVIGRAVVQS